MDAKEALKVYFGYDSFKPGQEEIIGSILAGKDVLAIMPTGSGKSICYQVPALLLPGITIVISPLISLMQDQVKALNEVGIKAAYINSFLTESQISKVYARALNGVYKILYVAPERLESYEFTDFSGKAGISMVTVDEAHCISQWGQDFRPSYLKIVDFIDSLSKRPIVSAFTATATEEVKNDISCVLKLRGPKIVMTGFDRENLYFDVETIKKKDDYVLEYVRNHPDDSGIIYCATRKNVDMLYELLSNAGVQAARYHAGMDVGEAKFEKYGERFIEAITAFMDENPESATSIKDDDTADIRVRSEKKRRSRKGPFYLNPEDEEKFVYSDLYLLGEIRDELNRITSGNNVKHIYGTDIYKFLTDKGYVEERNIDGRYVQAPTGIGQEMCITAVEQTSKIGTVYTVLKYPPAVQKEIVGHYVEIRNQAAVEEDEEDVTDNTSFDCAAYNPKMNRPDGAGAFWTKEEDKQLDEEYNAGMMISEMAKKHDRTNGAIRARLRKHGLIE